MKIDGLGGLGTHIDDAVVTVVEGTFTAAVDEVSVGCLARGLVMVGGVRVFHAVVVVGADAGDAGFRDDVALVSFAETKEDVDVGIQCEVLEEVVAELKVGQSEARVVWVTLSQRLVERAVFANSWVRRS